MKKNLFKTMLLAGSLTVLLSFTAFAGEWKQDTTGWWWQNDDGSYPTSQWQWVDGNNDGISECFYFDPNGYIVTNTEVEGSTINSDGAWVVDGIVQTKQTGVPENDSTPNTENSTKSNPYANDPLYISMRESAFAKLATITDFSQEEIKLMLTDVVFEENQQSNSVINYLGEEIFAYCKTKNNQFNAVKFSSMMADNNLYGNNWIPIFYIVVERNPYENNTLYVNLRNAIFAKIDTRDINEKRVNCDIPEITFSSNEYEKNMSRWLKMDLRARYSNVSIFRYRTQETTDGKYYFSGSVKLK